MEDLEQSVWFTTRSALFRPGDAAWNEIAAYGEPLRRFLGRRYRWLPEADRDDLVQEILLEMRKTLTASHDPSRGRFRALLQTVVKRRLADRLGKRRPASHDAAGESAAAPEGEAVEALDLEARLIEAVSSCRDRFSQGKERDLDVLYALVDRIVHGASSLEIAKRTRVSPDRVARLLQRGRDAIFESLLAKELSLAPGDERLERALVCFKECLRAPRRAARIIASERDAKLRGELEDFTGRFRKALGYLDGDETAQGVELRRGIEFVFEGVRR